MMMAPRVFAALTIVAAARGLVLPAPRSPALLWPRVAVAQHRPLLLRAALVASSEAEPPPGRSGAGGASVELEGKRISAGSDVICADEYGNWWMASVVDVRSAGGDVDILVHYKGCDPAMDEWLAATSGRVSPQPPMAPQAADETWRDVGEGLDPVEDADLLAELRAERQVVVDQWQYNTLCAAHAGEWAGVATRYTVRRGGASQPSLELEPTETFGVHSSVKADGERADSRTLVISEAPAPGATLERRGALTIAPSDMRAEQGHMAVGSGYTLTHRPTPAEQAALPGSAPLVVEIALSHNVEQAQGGAARGLAQRVRCTVGYSPFQGLGEEAAQARCVEWVEVAREVAVPMGSTAPADALPASASALLGGAGTGLYDSDAQRAGGSLYSLYCAGGITLVLPIELRLGAPAALSLDWNAGQMRYQADRKFDGDHDGALLTLELTEAVGS